MFTFLFLTLQRKNGERDEGLVLEEGEDLSLLNIYTSGFIIGLWQDGRQRSRSCSVFQWTTDSGAVQKFATMEKKKGKSSWQ